MFDANQGTADTLDGTPLHIGIVQARFNEDITNALASACRTELLALGVQEEHITHVFVPGALEVPTALQALAERDEYDALIALGCIIRGETYHFELVANESGAGVSRIALDYQVPVANYQHLVGRNSAEAIDTFTRDLSGFHKADAAHYNTVLHGCIETADALDALITPLLDRKLAEISPIEHAAMWIGVFEFQRCPDVPWRVVLNECIELAKEFGGTDGHKYVNGVLNGLAPKLRAACARCCGRLSSAAPSDWATNG